MVKLTVEVPEDLKRRLDTVAQETDKSLAETLLLAVSEFVETWERHLDDVHQIDEGERRAVLSGTMDE